MKSKSVLILLLLPIFIQGYSVNPPVTEMATETILNDDQGDATTEHVGLQRDLGDIAVDEEQAATEAAQDDVVVEEVVVTEENSISEDADDEPVAATVVPREEEIVPLTDEDRACEEAIKSSSRPLPPGFYLPDPCFKRPIVPEDAPEGVTEAPQENEVDILDPEISLGNNSDISIEMVGSQRVFIGRASCECGRSNQKIVGGEQASIHNYPWTAALVRKSIWGGGSNRAYCGGTLINSRYVVTASHCVDGMKKNGIMVVLNQERFSQPNSNHRYGVENIKMHERYNSRNIDNDIALIKLDRDVPLSSTITPVCLPASNDNDFTGQTATVVGWGATSQGGTTSDHLRKVDVPVISNQVCNSAQTKYEGKITKNMLCAGYLEQGQKDSCQGDSGGPLTIPNGTRKTLIGVVSWGYGCAQPKSPGVYTRVAEYPQWILKNTPGADWCQN